MSDTTRKVVKGLGIGRRIVLGILGIWGSVTLMTIGNSLTSNGLDMIGGPLTGLGWLCFLVTAIIQVVSWVFFAQKKREAEAAPSQWNGQASRSVGSATAPINRDLFASKTEQTEQTKTKKQGLKDD